MSLRERIDTLSRAELAGLTVVIVACVAGAAVWYLRSLPKPITVAEVPGATAPGLPGGSSPIGGTAVPATSVGAVPSAAAGVPVFVDVTGHVRRPGVYEFPSGARVIDAIEEAGGPRENAVLSALNLAAVLTDGQQIVVPGPRDEVAAGPVTGVPGASAAPGATGALININTADATALEALPGVGEVTAAAIVQHRTENGPFATVDQLEDVSGIGPATLEEIRPHATV
jgi:competence protein ComEA